MFCSLVAGALAAGQTNAHGYHCNALPRPACRGRHDLKGHSSTW